jgi:hypothetical protein
VLIQHPAVTVADPPEPTTAPAIAPRLQPIVVFELSKPGGVAQSSLVAFDAPTKILGRKVNDPLMSENPVMAA